MGQVEEMRRRRATVYTGDFHEYCTGWIESNKNSDLVKMAEEQMTEEWYEMENKRIIVEEELYRVRYTVCPHCRGPMIKSDMGHDYCCRKCGRGWRIKDKVWHALFSAGCETYTHEEVVEEQRHEKIWVKHYE
jgi:tRNA(Ile2) C34 agmatinyltransferase TiaS